MHAIYNQLQYFDILTIIMGASFRILGQIWSSSGCDFLTISPELLQQLANLDIQSDADAPLPSPFKALSVQAAKGMGVKPVAYVEASFGWALNEDAMATGELAEGIRAYGSDTRKLVALIQSSHN